MTWLRVLLIYITSAISIAHTLGGEPSSAALAAAPMPASASEKIAYACGRNLAALVHIDQQQGPLFSEGRLLFTSLEAQDFSPLLLVNSGTGNFVIRLNSVGLRRLRFVLPDETHKNPHVYFLSYMHGGAIPARYFDYSEDRPPTGHETSDYELVTATRADNLQAHLNYAIVKTAQATLTAIGDGRVTNEVTDAHGVDGCRQLLRQTPSLASSLRHSLDSIELMVVGVPRAQSARRLPASTATQARTFLRP